MRAERKATPPIPPPRQLVPVLRFAKLPDRALHTVAATLDGDADLRARVAAAVDGREIGAAGTLFLTRPEGWETELESLAAAARHRDRERREAAGDRDAARRLAVVEEEARVLADALSSTRDRLAEVSAALAAERAAHGEAQSELTAARLRITQLENERDAAHRRVAAADRELAALRRRLDAEAGERGALAAEAARRHVEQVAPGVARTVDAARRAAAELEDALTRAAQAIGGIAVGDGHDDGHGAGDASTGAGGRAKIRSDRRRPSPIPAGLTDDAVETAEHLVRLPRGVLLVDGYNASLRVWDDQPLAVQRERLVAASEELAARTGVEIFVVFDGATDEGSAVPRRRRLGVDVRFTPSHVEADDAILDLVDSFPLDRPVLVASDDHRVRDGAHARGANVLTQRQLFAVLRREHD